MEKKVKRRSTHKRYAALTIALFAVAAVLMTTGLIGGIRAALTYSQTYESELAMQEIGVSLYENDGESEIADGGAILEDLKTVTPGKANEEKLKVVNSGEIDEYVRLIVYRYWIDDEGKKDTTLDPSKIEITVNEAGGWKIDQESSNSERLVLYYDKPLKAATADSEAEETVAVTAIGVSSDIQKIVTQKKEGNTITTSYDYDGTSIGIKVEAQAVQTHNAVDAILSSWGVKATVASDGTLTIN